MTVDKPIPLNMFPLGTTAKIAEITCEFREAKHLADLGLTPGAELTVLRRVATHGPLEISIRGSRLALGERIAKQIIVEPYVTIPQ